MADMNDLRGLQQHQALSGYVQEHPDHGLAGWSSRGTDGDAVVTGTGYVVVNEGIGLRPVTAFFDPGIAQ